MTIVGEQAFLDAVTTNIQGAGAPTSMVDTYLDQNYPSLIEAALSSGVTLDDSEAATSYDSSTANAVLIGQSDTVIKAGNGNDRSRAGGANDNVSSRMVCAA